MVLWDTCSISLHNFLAVVIWFFNSREGKRHFNEKGGGGRRVNHWGNAQRPPFSHCKHFWFGLSSVGSPVPFHTKESPSRKSFSKGQQSSVGCINPLDSTSPKVKRGKERELSKLKRPTALKKIILKEREEKKGRLTTDHSLLGGDEEQEVPLTSNQAEELTSQEETGLSVPSDTSLSPASQNSPYCMTPVSQGSPASSGIGSPMASSTITKIHSKRFRE
ncbi:PREDICTED: selenocysteine insertion sequence-binding protein 2-like [Thamnophis sirtalis]|uniref:Selenocysteine insertion sequence-binding protein 2-like n=1 Tax=Thamnophis sirtalis TaxID=35019 RepID=A0A6I9YVP1_9SAUR|nr:PREDICTED: selenocysteine insertion sequence-binding protein 2-like [Thamnophis sirtalis]